MVPREHRHHHTHPLRPGAPGGSDTSSFWFLCLFKRRTAGTEFTEEARGLLCGSAGLGLPQPAHTLSEDGEQPGRVPRRLLWGRPQLLRHTLGLAGGLFCRGPEVGPPRSVLSPRWAQWSPVPPEAPPAPAWCPQPWSQAEASSLPGCPALGHGAAGTWVPPLLLTRPHPTLFVP